MIFGAYDYIQELTIETARLCKDKTLHLVALHVRIHIYVHMNMNIFRTTFFDKIVHFTLITAYHDKLVYRAFLGIVAIHG